MQNITKPLGDCFNLLSQTGASPDQARLAWHVRTLFPITVKPTLQLYAATEPKVV